MTDNQGSPNEAQSIRNEANPDGESTSMPDDVAPPLATLIASIRAAVTRGASAEARAAGATACRSLLAVLDAKPGQPLAALSAPAMPPASPASPLASLLSQPGLLTRLAAMSRDELINLLRQITGALPARPSTPNLAGPRFHLLEIPQVRRPGGGS